MLELKKRVLINVMLFGAGGGATHLLHLCRTLVKQGAEITLVCRYAHPSTPLLQAAHTIPIRVVVTPFSRNRRLYRFSTAWALLFWPFLLGRRNYDVLYTWELSSFTRFLSRFVRRGGACLLQKIGEPLAHALSNDDSLEGLLDGLMVETPIHAEAAERYLKRNVSVLSLPLIGHCFRPPERNGHCPGKVFRITFLGRYHSDKGIYRLLEIWPTLGIGEAELNFYAWGSDRDELQRCVVSLGLQDQIKLNDAYTTAEELTVILTNTDLVVLPSETEGFPVVLLEAMAHGVPFVATDVGAVQLLANENPDVRVVPLDNSKLKAAIEEMAVAIRSGLVNSKRLQAYYNSRYGYDLLTQKWAEALLFWNPSLKLGLTQNQDHG